MKKIVAAILCLAMAIAISVCCFAAEKEVFYYNIEVQINPLYKDLISVELSEEGTESNSTVLFSNPDQEYCETIEEAADVLRQQMEKRDSSPVVYYVNTAGYSDQVFLNIFNTALLHTGEPTEGDYLKWHWKTRGGGVSAYEENGKTYMALTYNIGYYTTAEQEAELDTAVANLLNSLDLEGKNDYQKVSAIYDYICKNITYDNENLADYTYTLKYTAYAALINKTSVCQGYANLFYRLALEEGIDARLVAGTSFGDNHGWNIVQMGDYYYNLDSTWDAGETTYSYFLKSPNNFKNHIRSAEYTTAAFNAEYPMGTSDYVYDPDDFISNENIIASGYCGGEGDGTNVEWSLSKDGTLTISGTGAMADYDKEYVTDVYITTAPWEAYSSSLKSLVIEKGVTTVGKYAFYRCSGFAGNLVLPETITEIGEYAFNLCSGFSGNFVLPENITKIGREAFFRCSNLTGNLVIPDGITIIEQFAFYGCDGFESLVLGENVTEIEGYAFYSCNGLGDSVVIPSKVDIIGDQAFRESSVEKIYFEGNPPSKVTEYSNSERSFNSSATIYYPAGNTSWENTIADGKWKGYKIQSAVRGYCGADEDGKNLSWELTEDGTLTISGTGAMADYEATYEGENISNITSPWWEHKDKIKKLVLNDGITYIGDHAFQSLGLEGELVIPSSVKEIGNWTFSHNNFSGDLILPEGLEKISGTEFQAAGDFGTISVPSTLISLDDSPFRYCEAEEIVVHKDNPTYSSVDGVLFSKDKIAIIQFPQTRTGVYFVPETVKWVASGAFEDVSLSGIIFDADVALIDNGAFSFNQKDIKIVFNGKVGEVRNAVMANSANAEIYFFNGAPESVYENSEEGRVSFDSAMGKTYTIYYYADDGSWELDENGLWNGYEVTKYDYKDITIVSGYCGADADGKNLEWLLTSKGTLTIFGTGAMADYSEGETPWNEYLQNIKTLILHNGITRIGNRAFCDAVNISGDLVIPESVTSIGEYAFMNCYSIEGKLVFPKNLEVIEARAFANCHGFSKIEVAEENQNYKSVDDVLYTKDGKTLILCSGQKTGEYSVLEGTETIGEHAFYNAKISSVVLPESVKTIKFKSFGHYSGRVVVKGQLEKIEADAFKVWNDVISVYFMNGAPLNIDETSFEAGNSSIIKLYYLKGTEDKWNFDENGLWNGYEVTAIGEKDIVIASGYCGAEEDGKNLEWVIKEDGTLVISGEGPMQGFLKVYEVDGPCVGTTAPWIDYKNLITGLEIKSGVTTIGDYAFYFLNQLSGDVTIPGSVAEIGVYAFMNCYNLTGKLTISEGVEKIERGAFCDTAFSGELVLPKSLVYIGQHAFQNNDFSENLVLPENLKYIYMYAFDDCHFENVTFPASVEFVGGGAFSGVTGNINVSADNENYCSVGGVLFTKDGKELVCFPGGRTGSYSVPEAVETIGDRSFNSAKLSKIVVSKNVKTIEDLAFEFFGGKVVVDGNPSIGDMVFYPYDENGMDVYFMAGEPSAITENSFNNDRGAINLYYLKGTEDKWNFDENGLWNGFTVNEYIITGDLNGDCEVNVKDVHYARLIAAKLIVSNAEDLEVGDVNGDGKINVIDANIIRKYTLGIITEFPILKA